MKKDPRWFIAPKYTTAGRPEPDVNVVNAMGEHVATFEDWGDAERAVELHNASVAGSTVGQIRRTA